MTIDWKHAASFLADTYEVRVEIGEEAPGWRVRVKDDWQVENLPDIYPDETAAREAARAFAEDADEGETEADRLREQAGEPAPDGEWACYWEGPYAGPQDLYASEEAARAAVELANRELRSHSAGHLLCGFEVRRFEAGEWVEAAQ